MAERTCETCGHSVVCHHWRDYYGCQVVAGMREWFEEHMRCGRGLPEWVERDLVDAWSAVTQQRDELQGDLATNANLLARQCDLAREAETRAMGAGAEVARLRAALYQIVASAAPRRCLGEFVVPCGECPVCVARAALEVTP